MDSHAVKARLAELGAMVEARLQGFADDPRAPRRLKEAMVYSLMAGGKRLRPVLLMSAASLFGTPADKVLPFACAVEMVHTYSLIHDDLPAMDDDDLRRGRPSCHKAFGEATAILAGDALQAAAFRAMTLCELPVDRVLAAVREFACAAGSFGMCGGQQLDMEAEEQAIPLDALRHLHALKTGAILRAAVVCGCLLAGAPERDVEAFGRFGASLGVAFQIADDILDVVGDTATLGKPAGSDAEAHKSTYPSLVGLEESRRLARGHADEAIAAIQAYEGQDADFLRGLANFTVTRVN
ncbi:MAG: polyprenyl synthetase family protein [Desulfovibrio sp.]|nr:polyprenyl synthetase family protein [Desulfovibrio sp.]